MTDPRLHLAASALIFFWCGCVTAISFLEAWLKFRAPGVTIPIGLGIGRLVFAALNKLEWVLAIAAVTCLVLATGARWGGSWLQGGTGSGSGWLLAAVVLLLLETAWLLPVLDKRAQSWLTGQPPATSSIHLLFVSAETIKLICLVVAGIRLLKFA